MLTLKQINSLLKNKGVMDDLNEDSNFIKIQQSGLNSLNESDLNDLRIILEKEHDFFGEEICSYSPQWENYPDPIRIKSLEGIFGVYIEDDKDIKYFDSEIKAREYADSRIGDFYDEDGWLDE